MLGYWSIICLNPKLRSTLGEISVAALISRTFALALDIEAIYFPAI